MDWTLVYVIATLLILPAFIYGGISHIVSTNTFDKYSKNLAQSGITANELARKLLENAGITDVEVVRIDGKLTDCYDPHHKVIKLSTETYDSSSIAALGVCAHEVGHAVQDAKGTFLFRLRSAIVPTVNFLSKMYIPLILLGSILSFTFMIESIGFYMIWAAIIMYGADTLFYFITLPLEHDASKRALEMLRETGTLNGSELSSANNVLKAAIQTYIATLAISLLYFLRFLSYALIFRKD